MKIKLTAIEKKWALYDVGNSAFTLLVSSILPIYFAYLAEEGGLTSDVYAAYWGYSVAVSTLIMAVLGPILGTLADTKGYKKPIFLISILLGSIGCLALGVAQNWVMFLGIFIIARLGYSGSLIFSDAMLPDITTPERMDQVSTTGFAWGYIGSCIPFVACLGVILGAGTLNLSMENSMLIAFLIIAIWWIAMSIPLIKGYEQINYVEAKKNAILESFARLFHTIKNIKQNKKVALFLLAFFFYIDGVYTIIDMATVYGKAVGLDDNGLLMALLVTQIIAFPCAIFTGRLAQKFAAERLITACIIAYIGIGIYAIFLATQLQFWILAILVGIFQGGTQALSRSYFGKIIPAENAGEYFGVMDICGKGATFLGASLVGIVSQMTGNVNLGVTVLPVMFIIGLVLFQITIKTENT